MISLVIPVYNEADHIYANVTKIMSILRELQISYEVVLVNDGSTDRSWEELKRLAQFKQIRAINLSRNFGKEKALCAGLENAKGEACVILDADLQHPPQLIPEMVRLWREEGYEVVEGVKSHRGNETIFSKLFALSFYKVFNKATGINLDHASDFKLLDRKVVDAWKEMKEVNTFFRGMTAWLGYKHIQVPFNVQARTAGKSKWSFVKLLKLALESITSFSAVPLYLTAWLGVILLFVDVILLAQTLFMKFSGRALNGFTTVIILQLGIGSFIMISLGIIGLYISKIYEEVKQRPRYLISEIQSKEMGYGKRPSKVKKYKKFA